MVPGAGLEPARPQWPGDFKSPVSTNFTTRAKGGKAEGAQDTTRNSNPKPRIALPPTRFALHALSAFSVTSRANTVREGTALGFTKR